MIKLRPMKIQKERVAIVYLGMNERDSNNSSSSRIDGIYDSTKTTNREEARFRLDTEEIWSDIVSDESKITPRLRAKSDGVM